MESRSFTRAIVFFVPRVVSVLHFFLGNESAITCAVVAVSIVWLIGVWFGGLYMVKRAVALSIDF